MLQNGETSIECGNTVLSMIEQIFAETLYQSVRYKVLMPVSRLWFSVIWHSFFCSEDAGHRFLWSIGTYLPHYMESYPRRQWSWECCVCYLQGLVCDRACHDLYSHYYTEFCWPWETVSPALMSGFVRLCNTIEFLALQLFKYTVDHCRCIWYTHCFCEHNYFGLQDITCLIYCFFFGISDTSLMVGIKI
jgi:hypothetical protein